MLINSQRVTLQVSQPNYNLMAISFPFQSPVIVVKQTLGDFYVAALPAEVLLDTCYSHRLQARKEADGSYTLDGSQREIHEPRLKAISEFIKSAEAAFPNSIILAANYREETGELEDDEKKQWSISLNPDGKTGSISIPSAAKLAAIIDGQHRLFGFRYTSAELQSMPLVCAIYFDLPKPYQAFLFATINSNQKSVDKSQTYELFGYNVEDEEADSWTPDKLAVFLTRKLNAETDSPLHHHIVIAAENDIVQTMSEARRQGDWMVSTATIVEGILKLISKNPKRDAYCMHEKAVGQGRQRSLLGTDGADIKAPPLRAFYLEGNDKMILTILKNYFAAVNEIFWQGDKVGFIRKTVGVQALFDILRILIPEALGAKNVSTTFFSNRLKCARKIDFSNDFFQASGTGKTRIRNVLEILLGMKNLESLNDHPDFAGYKRVLMG